MTRSGVGELFRMLRRAKAFAAAGLIRKPSSLDDSDVLDPRRFGGMVVRGRCVAADDDDGWLEAMVRLVAGRSIARQVKECVTNT